MSTLCWNELKEGKVIYFIPNYHSFDNPVEIKKAVVTSRARFGSYNSIALSFKVDGSSSWTNTRHVTPSNRVRSLSNHSEWYYSSYAEAKAALLQAEANLAYAVARYKKNIRNNHPGVNYGMDDIVRTFRVDPEMVGRIAFFETNRDVLASRQAAKEMLKSA